MLKIRIKSHTKITPKKEGVSVSREFVAHLPLTLNILSEIERRFRLSKNKEVSDELLGRFFIEELTFDDLMRISADSSKAMAAHRKIVSKLSLKDIAEISKELGEDPAKTVVDCLKERNIKIPETEEEMDKMLGIEIKNS